MYNAQVAAPRVEVISPFDTRSKFTKFHNVLLDVIMSELPPNAWKILCLIVRRTFGWGKDDEWLSYDQILEGTGIRSRATISTSLKLLTCRDCSERVQGNALVQIIKPVTTKPDQYEAYRYHINIEYVIEAYFDVTSGMYRRLAPSSKIELAPSSKIELAPSSKIELAPSSKIELNSRKSRKSEKKAIEDPPGGAVADDDEPPTAAAGIFDKNAGDGGEIKIEEESILRKTTIFPQIVAALRHFQVDNPSREELALSLTKRAIDTDGPDQWRKMVGRIFVCHRQTMAAQRNQRIFNPAGFFVHKLREMDGDYLATYEERGAMRGKEYGAGAGAIELLNTLEKSFNGKK